MKKALLILGNQLFDLSSIIPKEKRSDYIVFIREDKELCTYYRFHKQKILFFFLAMRAYTKELTSLGFLVHYEAFDPNSESYEIQLSNFIRNKKIEEFHTFEIEDRFFETKIKRLFKQTGTIWIEHKSPMFLTSRKDFSDYLLKHKKPFMKTFYEFQRRTFNILLDKNKEPIGGKWSYDTNNRKKLPKGYSVKDLPKVNFTAFEKEVFSIVEKHFPNHPGNTENFWLPTDRNSAKQWLNQFLEERLDLFGPYEDAFSQEYPFLQHSVLTPFLNVGLLTPKEVIESTLEYSNKYRIPIESLEGFIRQILGWREFIRGIYQNFGELQESKNYFSHKRKLTKHWYDGTTGIPPLDFVILKCNHYGYAHHIERLMVVGSLMVLFEVDPKEAYQWFMEMFIDSSDWVMGPNVYGMALFSDGGIFATKPYICGSNYYQKMGSFPKGEWEQAVDGLYWSFVATHEAFFSKNPRTSVLVGNLHRLQKERKETLFQTATLWKEKLTL
ncbi:cryptochrome/photolyase family protein [Leptospira bouyouniensis]|uniref:Cryptochrome/photolyase family protein n=1 Tax=Leptospira bouyouniensis TaxID=2484911 RepID=A0A7I0IML9_9LEPT|nr:cryptochrome/photolyase family protein [Leptospira bouyouniensis]TGL04720.1 cryptochrome/photolyase family protein [Leptospira bouyouniensis]